MASAGDDPPGAVDAMIAALAGEQCAIVIDDALIWRCAAGDAWSSAGRALAWTSRATTLAERRNLAQIAPLPLLAG
ncbi:MAG TPA: hypothetical protein VMF09_05070 [Solirubrobacteraceae bacterium]|nr:hypothetical protein [Solirubrobacteraceae bacterium]